MNNAWHSLELAEGGLESQRLRMVRGASMGQSVTNLLVTAAQRIGIGTAPPHGRGGGTPRLRAWTSTSTGVPARGPPRGSGPVPAYRAWRPGACLGDLSAPPEPRHHLQLGPRAVGERLVVVGDVHGCVEELRALLQQVNFRPSRGPLRGRTIDGEWAEDSARGLVENDRVAWEWGWPDSADDFSEEVDDDDGASVGDTLVLVGDLVNKGPDPVGVIRLAMDAGAYCVAGNHDFSLLRHLRSDGASSAASAFRYAEWAGELRPWEVEWLDRLPLTLSIPSLDVLVVHAGVVPGVCLEEQRAVDLLKMRSLAPFHGEGGAMGWVASEGAASAEKNSRPWAEVWSQEGSPGLGLSADDPKPHIYYGHDAVRGVQILSKATGLDGGVCYGGHLVAAVLPARGPRTGKDRRLCAKKARRQYAPTSLPGGPPAYGPPLESH